MHRIETNISLRGFNTFRIDAIARFYTIIEKNSDLIEIFSDRFLQNLDRKLVLGDGSNLLFVDDVFDGLVLHIRSKGLTKIETTDGILLKVAAGEKWTDLVAFSINENLRGLENLVGIPGTVGAAPIQNLGAYGTELSDVFVQCEVFDVEKKTFIIFNRDQCEFSYRNSRLKKANENKLNFIVTEVTIRLSNLPFDETKAKEILSRRAKILPDLRDEIGTAGSFFVNPIVLKSRDDFPHFTLKNGRVKFAAGWLIEQCGWKGRSIGSAAVSNAHGNVFVLRDLKNGLDLWTLAKQVRFDVQKRFQLRLEPEVKVIRTFSLQKVRQKRSMIDQYRINFLRFRRFAHRKSF